MVAINFLRGVQLRGSLGSSDGLGSSTMSPLPACRACIVCSKSTRWMVPGMAPSPAVVRAIVMGEEEGKHDRGYDSGGRLITEFTWATEILIP